MPLVWSRSLYRLSNMPRQWAFPAHFIAGRRVGGYRYITVQATPSIDTSKVEVIGPSTSASSPDASFEILGAPYSLLSATVSPSQHLFTRRGTLVGLSSTPSSTPDDVISTLRIISPLSRLALGIPFLYQRITSPTSYNALISTPSKLTTFSVLNLDGTTDWTLLQRSALLAWTGSSLGITAKLNSSLTPSTWGNTVLTGRGLVCLSGQGQIYSVSLARGESWVAHPSNVLAFTSSSPSPKPTPFRFKSSTLRFQIPLQLGNWFPSSRFVLALQDSATYKFLRNVLLRIQTWSRRTIWGDRLFLRFEGPATVLVQSRAARVADVLTSEQVNEIASAPAGEVLDAAVDSKVAEKGADQKLIVTSGSGSDAKAASDTVAAPRPEKKGP
ncbi:hypothetical protein DV736_g5227, partial [Chaetothyriales sp. CBS 134916]